MSRAPWSGTCARTRELGYADAMRDMWELMRTLQRDFTGRVSVENMRADLDLCMLNLGKADLARQVAEYAFEAWHGCFARRRERSRTRSCIRG